MATDLTEIIDSERITTRPRSGKILLNGDYEEILHYWLELRFPTKNKRIPEESDAQK